MGRGPPLTPRQRDNLLDSRSVVAMKLPSAILLSAVTLSPLALLLTSTAGSSPLFGKDDAPPASRPVKIAIDYPLDGSVFPPEITSPTFLWRDASETAKHWVVEISFAGRTDRMRVDAPGEPFQAGDIDPQASAGNEFPQLTPEQAATKIWRPDPVAWEEIKRWSVSAPATVAIIGFAEDDSKLPVSAGHVRVSTSRDPVGAPVFYRDVPFITSPGVRGSIQPLPVSALPLIKWRLRNIGEPESRTVMEGLYTCAPTAIRFRATAKPSASTSTGRRTTRDCTPSFPSPRK